ncbi:MAG: hypothetical protein KJO07_05395, partial [Deltaproteobacteria bacterium]|nr:hypothetical protein [Deltaproteobacteria bacterium]
MKRSLGLSLALVAAGALAYGQTFAPPPPPRKQAPRRADKPPPPPSRAYVAEIPDRRTFLQYSKVVGSDRFGKFIIDIKSNQIYFIDVNLFRIHADFVLGVLLKQQWTADNIR